MEEARHVKIFRNGRNQAVRIPRDLELPGSDALIYRDGARRKGSAGLTERVEQLLEGIEVLPLEPGVDRAYAEARSALETAGRIVGANDLLIVAHALEQGAVLVTGNSAEFGRVPGLEVQDWIRC